MSESFEQGMKIFRENLAGMYDNGHMTKWADADTSVDLDRLQEAHNYEIEHIGKSEYHRGYEDGRRSMDAEHYAVALRLRALPLDGDTTENLSQIARAVWHSDFGWTEGACKAMRDELVRLLGGVSERPYPTSTYDELGNERHKAVCELRKLDAEDGKAYICSTEIAHAIGLEYGGTFLGRLIYLLGGDEPSGMDELGNERHEVVCRLRGYKPRMSGKPTEEASKLIRCVTGNDDSHVACANDLEETRDRLIYLLGGNEKYFYASVREDGSIDRRADQSHESSPMRQKNETGITNELRECVETARKSHDRYIAETDLLDIADRIDEQFNKSMVSRSAELGCYKMHIDQLEAELDELQERLDRSRAEYCETCEEAETCDQLRAKLDEAEAAIANWREREKSFDASERLREELRRERDELRRSLRQIAERAGVPHDRDLSEYGDGQIANAVIGQLGETKQYVKSLEWVRDRRLPRIEAERDDLQERLDRVADALRERLDRVADALRGVERGTMSAWEAEESVRGS